MLEACFPLGPVVTSNETFWPSFSDLNPGMLIAEKCANKSPGRCFDLKDRKVRRFGDSEAAGQVVL